MSASPPRKSGAQLRSELRARLQGHREEIERAALTRIHSLPGFPESADPEYLEGLRAAVGAALEYGLVGVEQGAERPPAIPTSLLSQARLAARNSVSLDTVLRRYLTGYTLLMDHLIEEASEEGLLRDAELKHILRSQGTLFDRLLGAVADEHTRETTAKPDSPRRRREERIERLLAGELLGTTDLSYDFEAWHLGLIVVGPGSEEAIRDLARCLNRRLLQLQRGSGASWAWLGAREEFAGEELERLDSHSWPSGLSVAIGEPGRGLGGWRLTHRQAGAALPIALRSSEPVVRYGEVALLASIANDDLLATSLSEIYLAPLSRERDGGQIARQTLRAYFRAQRNVSSAAVALGVDRHTVFRRLKGIESRLNRRLDGCAAELEAVLQVEELQAQKPFLADSSQVVV